MDYIYEKSGTDLKFFFLILKPIVEVDHAPVVGILIKTVAVSALEAEEQSQLLNVAIIMVSGLALVMHRAKREPVWETWATQVPHLFLWLIMVSDS